MTAARRSVRLAWPRWPRTVVSIAQTTHAPSSTVGTWYDLGRPPPAQRSTSPRNSRATSMQHVSRHVARLAITAGAWAAVMELAELGRLVTLAALATWDWWYAAILAAILAGIATVLVLCYREWQR